MESIYPKDCIFLFNDVLTEEECDYFINITNTYAVKECEKYGPRANVLADSVNIVELSVPSDKKKVTDIMFERIIKLCKNFKETYDIDMGGFTTPTLRKIIGATRLHKDGIILDKQINKNGQCPASELRNMSIIVALNGDYEGGELCFPEHGRSIKLKKGTSHCISTLLDTPALYK